MIVPEGRWRIDRDHSSVNFAVAYLGVTKVRGRFMDLHGEVESADGALRGEATVAASSVQTGSAVRDRHLLSADFLDAEASPRLAFALGDVHEEDGRITVDGELTLKGVTRPIAFTALPGGAAKDAYGHDRVGLELDGVISRRAFGIAIDADGALVGDEIALEIDLSLVRERG